MSALTAAQRAKATLIAAAAFPFIAGLGATLRWKVEGVEHWDTVVSSGRRPILAFWHARIFGGLQYFRGRGIVVITSQNFDGEWIARILPRFGFGTARGSTSRGGARALVHMRRALETGRPVAFTVDGPRGPARVAQPGAVWLAAATGSPILPFHIEADRYWTAPSWDRTQIPKPFSTVAIKIGEPIPISSTEPAAIARGRVDLEAALARLEQRALTMLRERH
jgi:lysophospholipid acyltransferase (LPLAT)-like uncharacterized protein